MGLPKTTLHACGQSDRALHALADGELHSDDAVADVRGHVAGCSGCRARWDAIVGVRRLLVAATRRADPPMPASLSVWLEDMLTVPPHDDV